VGLYVGQGCMDCGDLLTSVAETLQAPIATSVSGKGCVSETHPLAVGWGYGPHGTAVAEKAFKRDLTHPLRSGVDVLLAIGVKFSEVSTGYYGNPRPKHVIHVDANEQNLGRVMPADVCVHADAELFLQQVAAHADQLRRPCDERLQKTIQRAKAAHEAELCAVRSGKCGVDPLALIAALRRAMGEDAMLFTDVSVSEHLAAESFRVTHPRTYFNPVDNQAMGWSIPAAIGAQKLAHDTLVVALTGDGCFLMSAMELATAAREGLPVKIVVLDDHAYHYMQMLQKAAYHRTTATHLPTIDYAALAKAVGVGYHEILQHDQLDASLHAAFHTTGPVLIRVMTDYGERKIRWIEAVRDRYTSELSPAQKARFAARLVKRTIDWKPENND
jgi:acetolactate synthase I/II/III large subunit